MPCENGQETKCIWDDDKIYKSAKRSKSLKWDSCRFYIPLSISNYVPSSEIWHRPDRKDSDLLYQHDGQYWTPDEYHAVFDYRGRRKALIVDPKYTQACEDDPCGKSCGRCGADNRHYDDVGWFYTSIENESYDAVCEACWDACGGSTLER